MILKFTDPLDACRAVVAESYRLWLQYEVRTDDITMILAFIDTVNDMNDEVHQAVCCALHGMRSARRTACSLPSGSFRNENPSRYAAAESRGAVRPTKYLSA